MFMAMTSSGLFMALALWANDFQVLLHTEFKTSLIAIFLGVINLGASL